VKHQRHLGFQHVAQRRCGVSRKRPADGVAFENPCCGPESALNADRDPRRTRAAIAARDRKHDGCGYGSISAAAQPHGRRLPSAVGREATSADGWDTTPNAISS
jgi:hypothetical protein